jgi:glycosyltransferase involved in cell wall biosynthesis
MIKPAWAVTMVKDEEDVVGYTLRHLIEQEIDGIIIADNMSSDKTREIIEEVKTSSPITIIIKDDHEPAYFQSAKMASLAHEAGARGAYWIVPFDADELIHSDRWSTIKEALDKSKYDIVGMNWWQHLVTDKDDLTESNPYKRMLWRNPKPSSLVKVIYKYHPDISIAHGNHGVLNLNEQTLIGANIGLQSEHYQYRSFEHMVDKTIKVGKAYLAGGSRIPDHIGNLRRIYYETYEREGIEGLRKIWNKRFFVSNPRQLGLVYNKSFYSGN